MATSPTTTVTLADGSTETTDLQGRPVAAPVATPASPTTTSGGGTSSPQPIPNLGDPVIVNGKNVGTAAFDPNTGQPLPRVTPPSAPTPGQAGYVPPAATTPAQDYLSGQDFTPPPTEDEEYSRLLGQSQDLITDTTKSYQDEINSGNAAAAARINASGLGGSSAGGAITDETLKPIIDARNTALDQIYQNIQTQAETNYQNDKQLADTEAQNDVAYQKQQKADNLATAQTNITALAKNNFDYNAASVPGSPNYQTYQTLLSQVGGDPNVLNAMFALAQPAENVVGSYFTSDGNGGTTVNQVVSDPVTGKISHLNYNIPGYSVPQNWQAQKIGTNSQLLTSPDFATDPSNPANWTFMSVDPTNNGAITVVSNGVTTVNGVPVNNNSPTATSAETAAQQAYASTVINNTATYSGVTDPTASMSDVIANANVGISGVVNGIIKQEGGSPSGVVNNPGNIKYDASSKMPGESDSGIKASDGGTFATFQTPDQGKNAVGILVQNAADSGLSFQQFITQYKGLGAPSSTDTAYDINSGVAPTDAQAEQNYVTSNGVNTGATNQAIYDAGVEYATTGKAPSLGNGSSGSVKAIKIAVQNAAAGYAKSLGTTYPKLQEEFTFANSVPTQTMLANSNTVINSISDPENGLITLSANVPRGNIQIKNGIAIGVGEGLSDPATVDFVNKVNSTADELGKIFGSGAGSDFTTQLAQSLINPNLSDEAFKSSMQTILGSVQNKVNAYQEQAGGTIGGSTNTDSSGVLSSTDATTQPDGTQGYASDGSTVITSKGGKWTDANGNQYDTNGNPINSSSSTNPNVVSFLNQLSPDQLKQLQDSLG